MKVTSEFLEVLLLTIKSNGYNGVCCINAPIVAVYLDQEAFPYMLVSNSYEFDFLDHFMELDISKSIEPNRSFDLLLCDTNNINLPIRVFYNLIKNKFRSSKEKMILIDKSNANRFIQSNLFKPANSDIANLISGDTIAITI